MNAALALGPLEVEFWRVAFLMTRIGAAMLAAPLFGAAGVPVLVRVVATGALAVFVAAWVPAQGVDAGLGLTLAGLLIVLGEVLVGLALGFLLQMAFAAPLVAAELIGGGMGMSMAVAASPDGEGQRSVFGNFLSIAMMLVFLGIGGHLVWLRLLIESYAALPPGETWLGAERFAAIARFGGTVLAAGVGIALPVTVLLLIVQLVTGILSRAAPALNIFALGLPLGVLAGLAGMIACLPLLFGELAELSTTGLAATEELLAP